MAGCGLWLIARVNRARLLFGFPTLPRHLLQHLDRPGDAQHRFPELLALLVEIGQHLLTGGELLAQLDAARAMFHFWKLYDAWEAQSPARREQAHEGDTVILQEVIAGNGSATVRWDLADSRQWGEGFLLVRPDCRCA